MVSVKKKKKAKYQFRAQHSSHTFLPSLMFIALLALLITVLFYSFAVNYWWQGTYLQTIFTERTVIPYITTYFFFLALLKLLTTFFFIRHERRIFRLAADELTHYGSIERAGADDVINLLQGKFREEHSSGIVLGRFYRLLNHLKNRGSIIDMTATLSEQSDVDRAVINDKHALVHFIIRVIPMLGFTGTVLGISLAVTEFPSLIDGAGEALSEQLGVLTANLGIAFETTLLALVKVAVIMMFLFMTRKYGADLMNHFDAFCLDTLLGTVKGAAAPEEEDLPPSHRDLARVIGAHIENYESKFENALADMLEKQQIQDEKRWNTFADSFRNMVNTLGEVRSSLDELKPALNELQKRRSMQVRIVEEKEEENAE